MDSSWPNPAGLDLFVSKAGLRMVLGFEDVTDLAGDAVRDSRIAALSAATDCRGGLCVIGLRERDVDTFAQVMPTLKVDFALVTLSTLDLPSNKGGQPGLCFSVKTFDTVYNSPRLRAWYTQNYDDSMPRGKMRLFPLGIDYHTLAGTPQQIQGVGGQDTYKSAVSTITPEEQDANVKSIYARSQPWSQRPHTLYVGAYAPTHATRESAEFKSIPVRIPGLLHVTERKSRWDMIGDLGKSKFVLAPRGLGMSSIRLYEAVMVGAVPVCDRLASAPMNLLHERLGAIIVDSWGQVNAANIAKWTKAIESKDYASNPFTEHLGQHNRTVLTTRFWMNCVRSGNDCLGLTY